MKAKPITKNEFFEKIYLLPVSIYYVNIVDFCIFEFNIRGECTSIGADGEVMLDNGSNIFVEFDKAEIVEKNDGTETFYEVRKDDKVLTFYINKG